MSEYKGMFNFISVDTAIQMINTQKVNSEKWKLGSQYYGAANAFCTYYKDTLKDEMLAGEENKLEREYIEKGVKYTESSLERKAREAEDVKEIAKKYYQALSLRDYLKQFLRLLEMEHETSVANTYRQNAELKANIYAQGS